MWIWLLWQGKISLKNAASLFIIDYDRSRGLDLSNEVFLISIGQRSAKVQVVKVGSASKDQLTKL